MNFIITDAEACHPTPAQVLSSNAASRLKATPMLWNRKAEVSRVNALTAGSSPLMHNTVDVNRPGLKLWEAWWVDSDANVATLP